MVAFVDEMNRNPKKTITYSWFATLFLVFVFFIVAICVAAQNDHSDNNKAAGFVAIWVMLLCIAVGAGGTYVMRKHHTALAVGFFLGIVVMMSAQMFMLFVIFVGEAKNSDEGEEDLEKSYKAGASFSFFLFLSYAIFSLLLARYRTEVVSMDQSAPGAGGVPVTNQQMQFPQQEYPQDIRSV